MTGFVILTCAFYLSQLTFSTWTQLRIFRSCESICLRKWVSVWYGIFLYRNDYFGVFRCKCNEIPVSLHFDTNEVHSCYPKIRWFKILLINAGYRVFGTFYDIFYYMFYDMFSGMFYDMFYNMNMAFLWQALWLRIAQKTQM